MKFICVICGLLLGPQTVKAAEMAFDLAGVHVRDFALSQDGSELYLTMESIAKDASQIIRLKHSDGSWSAPEVPLFSGQFKDLEPFLHPNGLQLFFASNRNKTQDGVTKQFDLWQVKRKATNQPWSAAERLSDVINTEEGNEFYPSVASNGNLYFTATKPDGLGKEDIYVSQLIEGQYAQPQMLSSAINSPTYEFNAFISPDEQLLIFSSYGREDDLGGGDMYYSLKQAGEWQPATNLGAGLNSKYLDYCPFYDATEKKLYWTSNRSALSEPGASHQPFAHWYQLFTKGENGLSKIYSKPIEFPPK